MRKIFFVLFCCSAKFASESGNHKGSFFFKLTERLRDWLPIFSGKETNSIYTLEGNFLKGTEKMTQFCKGLLHFILFLSSAQKSTKMCRKMLILVQANKVSTLYHNKLGSTKRRKMQKQSPQDLKLFFSFQMLCSQKSFKNWISGMLQYFLSVDFFFDLEGM